MYLNLIHSQTNQLENVSELHIKMQASNSKNNTKQVKHVSIWLILIIVSKLALWN